MWYDLWLPQTNAICVVVPEMQIIYAWVEASYVQSLLYYIWDMHEVYETLSNIYTIYMTNKKKMII